MATVIFFGKPGCAGNAAQRALLEASGHRVDLRNLLAEGWTPERLRPFFGDQPVTAWFNPAAPRVKSGEVEPGAHDETSALALLCREPLLIRRPLLQVGAWRHAGFDPAALGPLLGARAMQATEQCACPGAPCPPAAGEA